MDSLIDCRSLAAGDFLTLEKLGFCELSVRICLGIDDLTSIFCFGNLGINLGSCLYFMFILAGGTVGFAVFWADL